MPLLSALRLAQASRSVAATTCRMETGMVDVKFIAPTPIGGTDIQYAQGVRAGPWNRAPMP